MDGNARGKRGGFHYAYAIAFACMVMASVALGFMYGCSGIFFTPVSSYFGVPVAQLVLYMSVFNAAIALALPPIGRLMGRADLRVLLSICAVLLGGSYALMSRCTAIWQFYLLGATMGVGMTPFVYLVVPTLINSWFAKRVGFLIGLCMAFSGIIGMIFNPIGTQIIRSGPEGWRDAYLLFGCLIMAGILPFTMFVVRNAPADRGLEPYGADDPDIVDASAPKGIPAATALRTPVFKLIVVFIVMNTVVQTMSSFIPSYAESLGASYPAVADASGLIMATVQVGNMLGLLVLGFVNDRSLRLGVLVAGIAGAAGIALLLFFPARILLMYLGALALGVCYASTSIETSLLVRGCFGSQDYTVITSRVSAFGAGFAVIASPLWGAISATPLGYAPMLLIGIVSCAISIAAATMALSGAKALAMDAGEAGMDARDSRTPVSAG